MAPPFLNALPSAGQGQELRRVQAETAVGCFGHLVGPKLRTRSQPAQRGEVALAVQVPNRMIRAGKPNSVRR